MNTDDTIQDPATLIFSDIKGAAGQVVETWWWRLTECTPYTSYTGKWYGVVESPYRDSKAWFIFALPGCIWDYATGWFDCDYIKEASLGHDILHWLITIGIIDTAQNDAIDKEFYHILRERGGLPHWRARLLERAVNLVDQPRTGIDPAKIIHLKGGKRV